jgi:hypothetical protein
VRSYLSELLGRMAARESPTVDSSQSSSWRAHREAEALSDTSMIHELGSFLNSQQPNAIRSAAYFVLGCIGANGNSVLAAAALVQCLSLETDEYALSSLLGALAKSPKAETLEIRPVLALLRDKRWLVRHAAIESLKGTRSSEAEDSLLKLMEDSTDPHDLCYCHSTLNLIGTPKSLPMLIEHLKSPKPDVRLSAELAISAIRLRYAA